MVQKQIIDYIKTQFVLGVSRDEVKQALVESGWPEADIEDSLKSIEAPSAAPTTVTPERASPKSSSGETIIVSDLISNSDLKSPGVVFEKTATVPTAKGPQKEPKREFSEKRVVPSGGRSAFPIVILSILVVVSLGGAVFFYLQNRSFESGISQLKSQNDALSSTVVALNLQVAELTGKSNGLSGQATSLIGERDELASELSFFIMPPASAQNGASVEIPVTLKGVLGGGKTQYTLKTATGLTVYVKNSRDEKVGVALAPLVSSTIEISGTHLPASFSITVASVNGSSLK